MNLLKLKKLANSGHFDDLATLWPEAVEDTDSDIDELVRIVGQVRRLGADKHSDQLLGTLLSALEVRGGRQGRLDACRLAAEHLPTSEILRRELRNLYNEIYNDYDKASALTGKLLADGQRLNVGVKSLDRFLQLRPGSFLTDRSHLEPGMVTAVNGQNAALDVSFSGRTSTIDRKAVDEVIILPDNHFPSMLIYKRDDLIILAEEDPEAFVIAAVQSTRDRSCSYKDLRKHHATLNGADAWAKWWKKSRPVLKASSRLEMSGASQPTFRMLRHERSYEQRMREQFAALKLPVEKLRFVLDYLAETGRMGAGDDELLLEFGNAAAKMAGPLLETDPAMTLACLAVHSKIAGRGVDVAVLNPKAAVGVLGRCKDPSQLPAHLGDQLLLTVLKFTKEIVPDRWAIFWAKVLPRCGRLVSEGIVRELLNADKTDELTKAFHKVLGHPTAAPDVLGWLWRARHTDTKQAVILRELDGVTTRACFDAMLQLIDATGRMAAVSDDKRLRKTLDQSLDTLALYDCNPIRDHVEQLDIRESRELKTRLDTSDGLRASLKATISAMIRTRFPDIFVDAAKPWQEEVLYTSERALQMRQAEFNRLLTEEIPAVAKQIGEAASHGDLSENSEYTAALEKRDQITSNATRIENELAIAKIIDRAMTETDFVNVGTRVTLRDLSTSVEETMTFCGIWESQPEKGILSYQAPLALAFMGQTVGDQVEFGKNGHKRRWEILSIESAME